MKGSAARAGIDMLENLVSSVAALTVWCVIVDGFGKFGSDEILGWGRRQALIEHIPIELVQLPSARLLSAGPWRDSGRQRPRA
jgi:hypothetical protein